MKIPSLRAQMDILKRPQAEADTKLTTLLPALLAAAFKDEL
jgi:hypothetical protein